MTRFAPRHSPPALRACSLIPSSSSIARAVPPGSRTALRFLAGEAPPAVENLTAEMRKDGVLLRWAPAPSDSSPVAIRLVRRLLSPPVKKSDQGPLPEPAEPLEQSLLVEPIAHSDRALDKNIRFGETYEYRAQRVARITVGSFNA